VKNNTSKNYTLKDLSFEDRPREKLFFDGGENLSNAELLAILLNNGNRKRTAVELGQDILQRAGSLRDLAEFSAQELCEFSGVGPAKAARIIAAIEFAKRLTAPSPKKAPALTSPAEAARFVIPRLRFLQQEVLLLILLNSKNKVIKIKEVSRGGLSSTLVHPREIFKVALKKSASAVILCHNHPSGETEPSRDDIIVTEKLISAGKLLGISVLDHLIVANNSFLSLKEEGYLQNL